MPWPRAWLAVAVVVPALLVQATVLNRLPLPGATPNVVLVAVIALALVTDLPFGLLAGFWAGLAADLLPPADHALGRLALVFALAGALAAWLGQGAAEETERSAAAPLVVVGVVAAAASGVDAAVGAVLGDPRVTGAAFVAAGPTAVAYDLILAPFVLPAVTALARRVDPEGVFR